MKNKKLLTDLSEKECYALLYKELVFSVYYYYKKVDLVGDGSFYIEENTHSECVSKAWSCITDPFYYTIKDVFKKWFKRIYMYLGEV